MRNAGTSTNDVVIRADGLGKHYIIGHKSGERFSTLRDQLAKSATSFARQAREALRGRPIHAGDELEEFWALKDVSFEIKRGDVVGVIGRNGAGKSTLLKILSRITEPSAGRVEIRGRVASLLEVGTGFHPELTGRENIYLNGSILGMTRSEISRKFDEIVAFAEVSRFLDTPVKRYSSGMYVRLAFAVAAHLEPEILVVDEVLAVGDAEFQRKCLGKMQDVAGAGRTVLFVSHNLASINSLCDTGLLLQRGQVGCFGRIHDAVSAYSQDFSKGSGAASAPDDPYLTAEYPEKTNRWIRLTAHNLDLTEDLYEIRNYVTTMSGEVVGVASVGGFGNAGLPLGPGDKQLSITLDVAGLASGSYRFAFEIVRNRDYRTKYNVDNFVFDHNAEVQNGETGTLQLSWGRGYVRFPVEAPALTARLVAPSYETAR
jgi:lipopolysaccharide transport system ATP-binding protein